MKRTAALLLAPLILLAPALSPVIGESAKSADPDKPKNTLRWSTASEVDNFGFDVYRALKKDGPFERMTKRPIAGAGTIDTTTRYIWVDEDIDPAVEYWYYVESISMQGHREPFTPMIRAPAKNSAAAAGKPR